MKPKIASPRQRSGEELHSNRPNAHAHTELVPEQSPELTTAPRVCRLPEGRHARGRKEGTGREGGSLEGDHGHSVREQFPPDTRRPPHSGAVIMSYEQLSSEGD